MKGYITVQEAAQKWGITPCQVQILCKEKRVISATRISGIQIIPENVEKPTRTPKNNIVYSRSGNKNE